METSPPQVLRIKRKRAEDPLQALILEGRQPSKKSKPATPVASSAPSPSGESRSYYFQLEATESTHADQQAIEFLLSESKSTRADARSFVIPKKHTYEDTIIPNELSDMVADYLSVSQPTTRKKRKAAGRSTASSHLSGLPQDGDDGSEYVLDTYKLTSIEPLTEANYPKSQIGYIRFFDDEEYDLMKSDDEDKSNPSEDEDSNAESFYQNDYPEDEDAGAYSDSYAFLSSGEESGSERNSNDGFNSGMTEKAGVSQTSAEFDNLYDDLMNHGGESFAEGQTYERQTFFDNDADDELAIHRDRIFSRLQKMIDEE